MPGAVELLRGLPEKPGLSGIPIVVLTRVAADDAPVPDFASAAAILPLPPQGPDDPLLALMSLPHRLGPRYAVQFCVQTWMRTDNAPVAVEGLDLSVTGMLGESPLPFRIGDALDLRLLLPGSVEPVFGSAKVVRRAAPRRFGIHFLELLADGAEGLRTFLEG